MNKISENLKLKAENIRLKLINLVFNAKSGHIGGDLSSVNILTVLYFKVLNIDPKNPKMENRDRFIMSKGHSAEVLYCILEDAGFFDEKILNTYGNDYSILGGHPNIKIPGIEVSTGALGHGLSIAVGLAIAGKLDEKNYKTYVLMGDGEQGEGSIYEAALAGGHYKLDNLVAIIDRNKLQISDTTENVISIEPLKSKWEAFGWDVIEVDGTNVDEIVNTFENIDFNNNKPHMIISKSIKGEGVSFMENVLKWHNGVLNEEDHKKAVFEIEERINTLKSNT